MAKSRDSVSEEAPLREKKLALSLDELAQSASELPQSMSPLISGKVPGLFHWVSSAAEKQARSFSKRAHSVTESADLCKDGGALSLSKLRYGKISPLFHWMSLLSH